MAKAKTERPKATRTPRTSRVYAVNPKLKREAEALTGQARQVYGVLGRNPKGLTSAQVLEKLGDSFATKSKNPHGLVTSNLRDLMFAISVVKTPRLVIAVDAEGKEVPLTSVVMGKATQKAAKPKTAAKQKGDHREKRQS